MQTHHADENHAEFDASKNPYTAPQTPTELPDDSLAGLSAGGGTLLRRPSWRPGVVPIRVRHRRHFGHDQVLRGVFGLDDNTLGFTVSSA